MSVLLPWSLYADNDLSHCRAEKEREALTRWKQCKLQWCKETAALVCGFDTVTEMLSSYPHLLKTTDTLLRCAWI